MSTPRIVVVGSINMDLTTSVSRFPTPGETLLGTAFATAAGGKGSNQAIAAAKAGGDVSFVGAVGHDFGASVASLGAAVARAPTGAADQGPAGFLEGLVEGRPHRHARPLPAPPLAG